VKPRAVLESAFESYKKLFSYLAPLSCLGFLFVALYSIVLAKLFGAAGLLTALVLIVVGAVWISGLLIQTVHDLEHADGDGWIGARLQRLWPRVNALSAGALITGIAIGVPRYLLVRGGGASVIGLALFIVAVFLMVRWAVWVPFVVIEDDGAIAALRRSGELTRGHGWQVFCVLFIQGILVTAVSLVLELPLAALSDSAIGAMLAMLLALILVTPFSALVQYALYGALDEAEQAEREPAALTA
jgi:hypothetical protein